MALGIFKLARIFRAFLFPNGPEMALWPVGYMAQSDKKNIEHRAKPIFDVTRWDDPAYWAAAAVLADRDGDTDRARLARDRLSRLGYRFDVIRPRNVPRASEGGNDAAR